ncbi:aldehyde dehydrogenase (plasmid) [Rhodococcus jostii RHA1]|uniref:Aldehyde dehydrogenase n=1 Tax=Rhodococcus jostii (strain RHA1) TaxID=101510 RepID=Q0RVI3_RHOJR|nr:aldehyde dehydrogenase family protein [Rhodococcus jostii]ABH00703.1 aldehyde dehydrogenase [Rhodococcus jostii RHA1]
MASVEARQQDHAAMIRGRRFAMLIDGELVDGATSQNVIDPATEDVIATAPVADSAQVDQAVHAALKAFHTWQHSTFSERSTIIDRIADAIEKRREEIARIITLENGKPLKSAQDEVDWSLSWARHVAGCSIESTIIRDDATSRIKIRHKPIGVVAAIIPWNFPFFQMVYKVVPALFCGNTVVVKPAPTTPLNAMVMGEILQEIIPKGVVNIVGDLGEAGPHLTSHSDVGKVSFTGSTAAGRKVMASSAETLKRVVLELGGNDAAIVMDDADVEKVAEEIFSWAFVNSGQVCINIKRVFVPRPLYDRFCDAFASHARAATLGHGLAPETDLGPVQNARQYEAAKAYLELAKKDGTVIAGGNIPDVPGYFVEPTVVRDIDDASALVREETFGPVRSILSYDDLEDAVARVNDTPYGLGNSVWGSDLDRAAAVADRLEGGTSWVNTHFSLAPDVPFGGRKQSGIGVEFGIQGIMEFTETHVINVSKG